jgi:glycosyltransferase involved in cell wall biosynthesis
MEKLQNQDFSMCQEEIPDLSLVLPCYNEEKCLESTVPPLARAFSKAGVSLQIVLVDNGSTDRTSEVIDRLIVSGMPVTKGVVKVNEGQGLGFLTGFRLCRGRYIGHLCADGQVTPEDVVRVFQALKTLNVPCLAKARRRFRPDSWVRKIVSIIFNGMMLVLFPGIPALDVNGNPKIMPADVLRMMELNSRDWFLEAEVMLKTWHLNLRVIELDIFGLPQRERPSYVRLAALLEFLRNIVAYRVGTPWRDWRKRNSRDSFLRLQASEASASSIGNLYPPK